MSSLLYRHRSRVFFIVMLKLTFQTMLLKTLNIKSDVHIPICIFSIIADSIIFSRRRDQPVVLPIHDVNYGKYFLMVAIFPLSFSFLLFLQVCGSGRLVLTMKLYHSRGWYHLLVTIVHDDLNFIVGKIVTCKWFFTFKPWAKEL